MGSMLQKLRKEIFPRDQANNLLSNFAKFSMPFFTISDYKSAHRRFILHKVMSGALAHSKLVLKGNRDIYFDNTGLAYDIILLAEKLSDFRFKIIFVINSIMILLCNCGI